jgi:hypothetical protein
VSNPLSKVEELQEQAGDWSLIALLLQKPQPGWPQRLRAAAEKTVDPELRVAADLAHGKGNDYFHECLFGPNGLLLSRESCYRSADDHSPLLADLSSLADALGYSRVGDEPADHIVSVVDLMAHVLSRRADAMADGQVGEAMYLEGVAEWLRRAHLAWFTEQIVKALSETEVCYLSHVARALEARVHPPGEPETPRRRPSEPDSSIESPLSDE